ncbi:MAG: TatD family nuclease-associated radical SAM protein [Clostridia bacterium]
MQNITYTVKNGIYINMTNRCTNRCTFCIRNEGKGVYGSDDLWLEREPTSAEILADLKKYQLAKYDEIVFCGYGEPTILVDELCETARAIKQISNISIRINTNGQANLIHKRDITPLFKDIIDVVSISMNTADKQSYFDVCNPAFGIETYQSVLDFGLCAAKNVKTVIFSVVRTTIPDEDIEKCRALAKKYGGELRVREFD